MQAGLATKLLRFRGVFAARALAAHTDMDARAIAETAMGIAADICVYTNRELTFEQLGKEGAQ